jgi:hypothetical protein
LVINQAGIVRHGLLGSVDLIAWCILDYIGGWFFSRNARRVVVEGREFVWMHYEHAVEELPLLFNPEAGIATRKNQLSRLVQSLRAAGLVESVRVGRDLYLRPSDTAAAIASSRERNVTKSAPAITPAHGDSVTSPHDNTVTAASDDSAPTYIDETTIKETTLMESPPPVPQRGKCARSGSSFLESQVELIYDAYPKKAGKPTALRAIRNALAKHEPDFLLERTKLFAATYRGEARFIPHPSRWFSQERYSDDPSTWMGSTASNGRHQPKLITPNAFTTRIGKL